MGDLLNEVAYQIRPYEVVPGRTDVVLRQCVEICSTALRAKSYDQLHGGVLARLLASVAPVTGPDDAEKVLDQLRGTHGTDAFARCRQLIEAEIEVDLTRAKPICKITGEFWAQTTEGDGNFRMFPFLEGEGAEVLVEPIATWIAYMLHQATQKARDRRGLRADGAAPGLGGRLANDLAHRKRLLTFSVADRLIGREYDRLRQALGGTAHPLANQLELTRVGHPYYHSRAGGGEGHLEVAKNIYYMNRDLSHMVLSLKPFGCMPSTQSDGAQAAVVAHFKDMIYLPVETSGEGDINAHSRVQMALGEAKAKCKDEFTRSLERTGYALSEIRAYVADRPELRRPLRRVEHRPGVVGRAANFVLDVAERMRAAGVARAV
jgi:predicted nucleotide-binding protein (sugar kinase/HSP70/actin superfamily)